MKTLLIIVIIWNNIKLWNIMINFKEEIHMKQSKVAPVFMPKLAKITVSALCAVLFICANTNSCCMVHQPRTPTGLERFSKFR